eukprot:GHVP01029501.1.p1 GENE.GHVP01029501.1~~GHVP01029501.1.p1  ORF type:complete len:116 (+),score=12.83 GHVP01029501.1:448-795(+)
MSGLYWSFVRNTSRLFVLFFRVGVLCFVCLAADPFGSSKCSAIRTSIPRWDEKMMLSYLKSTSFCRKWSLYQLGCFLVKLAMAKGVGMASFLFSTKKSNLFWSPMAQCLEKYMFC